MTRALTAKEADQTVPRAKRKATREEAALKAREETALSELDALGVIVSLHEPPRWDDDPLRGIEPGWRTGTCFAVAYSTDGRRKQFSGVSAVQVLDNARLFLAHQEGLKPDAPGRFVIAKNEDEISVPQVFHRQGSEQVARERRDKRKTLSFQTGTAEVVEGHGIPTRESNHASQFSDAEA